MAKKARLGLGLFFNNTTNSGIVNYVYNIVAALHTLPFEEQPVIILLHNDTAEISLIKEIKYPAIHFILLKNCPENFFFRKINNALKKINGKNYYKQFFVYRQMQSFYPYFPFLNLPLQDAPNKIQWLVDFNNRAFPQHYEDGGTSMKIYQEQLVQLNERVIVSSYAMLDELKLYYPQYKNDVKVLKFACSFPPFQTINIPAIKQKHGINGIYFMSPNQFWEHKNQVVVLDAIHLIKTQFQELEFKIIFTGSQSVNRGKGLYFNKLQEKIKKLGLEEHTQFLGILDRSEQIILMKDAVSLIQPSLYEGWSTLVEEAKALNKHIILSDLPVHREHINSNASFFDPHDPSELARLIYRQIVNSDPIIPYDYTNEINSFAKNILTALC